MKFLFHKKDAKEILNKFEMEDSNVVGTPMECGVKVHANQDGE